MSHAAERLAEARAVLARSKPSQWSYHQARRDIEFYSSILESEPAAPGFSVAPLVGNSPPSEAPQTGTPRGERPRCRYCGRACYAAPESYLPIWPSAYCCGCNRSLEVA